MSEKTETTRALELKYDDNGKPSWRSSPSHKNIKVRGGCDLPPHLPGLIILVHGVNSTGEWYQNAEVSLCDGLNDRLGLNGTQFELKPNKYSTDCEEEGGKSNSSPSPLARRELIENSERSPIIRFYWGYSSVRGEEDKYFIPLANVDGEDYHQMKRTGIKPDDIQKKGPYIWGGGPFQNGTNNLHSLWSNYGFDENLAGIPGAKLQYFNEDKDRLLTNAPPRKYYSHAAKRLADLLDLIRDKYPNDTVSIISHSQGTMVSLAAVTLAKKGPDALFILNSPYAMHNSQLNEFSIPQQERISPSGRENTLSSIIEKIAKQSSHLSSVGYKGLCVGKFTDNSSWKPEGENVIRAGKIQERDNHGRTYIYFCPHDRVMGSLPLRSIGWQGLPNDKTGNPHPLIVRFKNNLYQRMLARNTPCGSYPDKQTPFGTLPDGKPFWDDKGDQYQSSSITYPDPPEWQTVFVNAEKVPEPINPSELAEFDVTRVGKEHDSKQQDGWGEVVPKTGEKYDNTYDNYVNLYPNQDVVIGYKELPSGYVQEITRKETFEEKDKRLRTYVSQPTDHSTLPGSKKFMSRVVAYDLPIGYCDATWDKEFLSKLRYLADWTTGADPYMNTGIVESINEPSMISRETGIEEMIREKAKEYGY
ncbi:T6SS effector phospholipase Tle3 domain-containing protein [Enterobacter cloacae]|uniref:T6SS effector phospholipase Tle3 domain-containing protein n=1 Tax=Enterobacter cloacae TaxID=550 RepID=UPI002004E629|nr:DUF3274 domain-containing protein [Enterobacter cloacae]MCK6718633.1 DUF3274 domain-containing protein [Enterobacter cloacae]